MSYKVEYGSLRSLLGTYSGIASGWQDGIASVIEKEAAIEASTNISGNSADRMREYLKTVYMSSEYMLSDLLDAFKQNFLVYTDAYLEQVDGASDTNIAEDELSERQDSLRERRSKFQQIGLDAETAIEGLSDLVTLPSLDISDLDSEVGGVISSIDNLNAAVTGLEAAHVSADFAEIDELITRLDAFFREVYGQNRDFKTSFSMESFAGLASVPALFAAYDNLTKQMAAQEASVKKALENLETIYQKEQEELERRKQQAEWAKVGVNVLVGLASAALLVTAGPVGAIVIGAVGGAVSSAFSASADEYVEHGWNMKDWNTDRIQIHACIGTVTGMIGGMFPGAGPYAKAGIKACCSAFEGVASTSYDQIAANGRITDVKAIVKDAAIKGGSTFVGNLLGNAVSGQVSDFIKQNDTIKDVTEHVVGGWKHFGATLLVEEASGVSSGMVKRFSSTAVEETIGFADSLASGKSLKEAYDEHNILSESVHDAIDVKEIVGDTGSAVSTAATDNPMEKSLKTLATRPDDYYKYGDSPDLNGKKDGWKGWNSEEYDRMNESLRKMDERGDDARTYAIFGEQAEDPVQQSLEKLENRPDDYYLFGDSPDLNGNKDGWNGWNSEEYDRMTESLRRMDERGDDARAYAIFGDKRGFAYQRQSAIKQAWKDETHLVLQGRGTRDWSVSQQEELLRTGKVSGFDGSHMLDASSNPSAANVPDNIQFLTYEEHIWGAHGGDTRNQTTGWYDTKTGETIPINPRQIPHREQTSFELSQKFDYSQADVAEQLGSSFGYDRGSKSNKK